MPQPEPSNQTLVQLTVRLEMAVADALYEKARRFGQEPADYAAGVLTRDLLDVVGEADQATASRIEAELEVRARAIALARRFSPPDAFDRNVTLKVFREIRTDAELRQLYERAIGDRPGDERGNPIKARINRSLGAMIKAAVGADVEEIDRNPIKVQVSGEYIFSYTLLKPGKPKAWARR